MTYTGTETAAIARLTTIAKTRTGQGRKVANFLLAWWNAEECGGFDLTTFACVDDTIAADMLTVCGALARELHYMDSDDVMAILRIQRPDWLQQFDPPPAGDASAAGTAGTRGDDAEGQPTWFFDPAAVALKDSSWFDPVGVLERRVDATGAETHYV